MLAKRTSGLGANCFRRQWKEGVPFPLSSIPYVPAGERRRLLDTFSHG
jgi:hypothetical protein